MTLNQLFKKRPTGVGPADIKTIKDKQFRRNKI